MSTGDAAVASLADSMLSVAVAEEQTRYKSMCTGDGGKKRGRCSSQSVELHAECVHGRHGGLLCKACLPGKQANKNEDSAHANQVVTAEQQKILRPEVLLAICILA